MKHRDNILQYYVAQMENGKPLELLMAELPAEDKELAPMLAMAAALRKLPDPEMDPFDARAQDRKVMMAIRLRASRIAPSPSTNGHRSASSPQGWRLPRPTISRPLGLVGALAVALVLFLAFLFVSQIASPAGPARDQATLSDVAGLVEVTGKGQVAWRPASSGDTLREGQRIRVGPGSTASLVFFEGTRTRLAAGTDLSVVMLDGRGDSLRVELNQLHGRSRHDVVPLRGDEALYLVHTPGGSAIVHGTVFDVRVSEDGTSEFNVTEGEVAVSAAGQEVLLGAGQMTTAVSNSPPAAPTAAFQPQPELSFTQGEVATAGCAASFSLSGSLANVATDPVDEAVDVSLGYNVIVGAQYVAGVSLDPAGWPVIPAGQSRGFLLNVAMNADWDGASDDTEVKVRVFVADESNRPEHHVAGLTATIGRQCMATPAAVTTITPTVTITPTITPTPTVTITPTVTVTPTVTPTPTVTITPTVTPTATVTTDCTGANPHPHATTLADRYSVSYEEVMGWFCGGNGFGEIMISFELSRTSGVPADEIFAMRASGLGWGQIGKELGTSPGGGPPDWAGPPEGKGPPEGAGPPEDRGNSNNGNRGNGNGYGNGNNNGNGNGNNNGNGNGNGHQK